MINKKVIKYKDFYLALCETKTNWTGTIFSHRYDFSNGHSVYDYYKKLHIEYTEGNLLLQMKEEIDKFIEDKKKYLEREIVVAKRNLEFLTKDLDYLNSIEKEIR